MEGWYALLEWGPEHDDYARHRERVAGEIEREITQTSDEDELRLLKILAGQHDEVGRGDALGFATYLEKLLAKLLYGCYGEGAQSEGVGRGAIAPLYRKEAVLELYEAGCDEAEGGLYFPPDLFTEICKQNAAELPVRIRSHLHGWPWLETHLCHLFHMAHFQGDGYPVRDGPLEGASLLEFLLIEYAEHLRAVPALSQLALRYFSAARDEQGPGQYYAEEYLDRTFQRLDPKTDQGGWKLINLARSLQISCRPYGHVVDGAVGAGGRRRINNAETGLCLVLARQALLRRQHAGAIDWLSQGSDADGTDVYSPSLSAMQDLGALAGRLLRSCAADAPAGDDRPVVGLAGGLRSIAAVTVRMVERCGRAKAELELPELLQVLCEYSQIHDGIAEMRTLTGGNAGFGDEDERAFDRLRLKLCDLLAAGDASQGGDPDRAKVPAELWGLLLAEAETFCKMITPAFSADHNFLLMSRLEEYSALTRADRADLLCAGGAPDSGAARPADVLDDKRLDEMRKTFAHDLAAAICFPV